MHHEFIKIFGGENGYISILIAELMAKCPAKTKHVVEVDRLLATPLVWLHVLLTKNCDVQLMKQIVHPSIARTHVLPRQPFRRQSFANFRHVSVCELKCSSAQSIIGPRELRCPGTLGSPPLDRRAKIKRR
jgi:hypothetical protein